jgi:ABC-2 type transport system ATP-binding protein
MREAESLCDRVAIIINGRFVTVRRPQELLYKYKKTNLEDVFLEVTGREWKEVEDES